MRPTLQDVAREASVSKAAASIALSGKPGVSNETRERVRAAAAAIGYRRDPVLSRLGGNRWRVEGGVHQGTLALVDSGRSGSRAGRWFDHRFGRAVVREAAGAGYTVDRFEMADYPGSSLERVIRARNIRGVVLHASGAGLEGGGGELGIPTVCCMGNPDPGIPLRVTHNYVASISTVVREMRSAGYHRVGLAMKEFTASAVGPVWAKPSYSGISEDVPIFFFNTLNDREGRERFLEWVVRHGVEGVVSGGTGIERSVFEKAGVSLPGRFGFCCLDLLLPHSRCAGIYQRRELIAKEAVNLLLSAIAADGTGGRSLPRAIQVDGVWNPGETLRGSP